MSENNAKRKRKTQRRKPRINPAVEEERLIRVGEAAVFFGIDRSTLWRWMHDPDRAFPPVVRLSRGVAGWPLSALKAWRDRHLAASTKQRGRRG